MSDQANRRLSIDLDEIERQLRHSAERHASLHGQPPGGQASAPAAQGHAMNAGYASQSGNAPAQKSDPLAELARIVGQDDPFDALLAGDRGARGRAGTAAQDPRTQDPYAQDTYGRAPYAQDPYAQDPYAQDASGRQEPGFAEDPRAAYAAHGFAVEPEPRDPRSAGTYDDYRDDPRYDDQAYAADWAGAPPREDEDLYEHAPRKRPGVGRKSLVTAIALVGVAVVGVGSALMFSGSVEQSGEPPLIVADPTPVRISPEEPGGVEIPNQNKAIYGQDGGETRIVDREEQPVDVGELARRSPQAAALASVGTPDADGDLDPIGRALAGDGFAEPGLEPTLVPSAAVAALGEPRRVRTVTVRPDGSVVAPQGTALAVPTPAAPPPALAALDPAPASPSTIADLVSPSAEAPSSPAPIAPVQALADPVPTETASAGTAAAATTAPLPPPAPPRSGAIEPSPQAPAQTPAPLQLSALPQAAAPALAPSPAPAAVPDGGYAVQLAIRGSEDRAREAFQQLQARYSGIIGDGQPIIRQALVNGSTIFRVRVGPYPLDRATQACDQIKSSGGDCFVAPNR